ncbi:ABC transporter substrate-binding protein [Phyllobacterium brassicacearum]|uniref:ABC transporter substrate-binding protein n=1 Tax=Phyllobacterium brassicacearum TaxID=314235 RepID=A0A2P7BQF5_9HYPH|nr:CmpA/NrtA family ABC transporter substrate-binding protein [Phyllobacterium brassicacearum]PSH68679.1 ABC transporter substrate-binding protein [Phyllobacterium brassicacearum]TDQ24235.1 NitT/TauT family transport system ATP-binding protein [Phyllobacterium brassicacearum]
MSFIRTGIDKSQGSGVAAPATIRSEGTRLVRAGFIPLVDASVLIAASEFGFAAREGVQLDLVKDVSWANIRDRLAFRQFDIAHMLAPMPVASALGLGSNPSPVIAPFSLGRGGNAITLSVQLYRRCQAKADLGGRENALTNAKALKLVIEEMRSNGEALPVLGMTYPFSSHNYELRYWLAAGGIHPDHDVKLVVVPPPMTSDALSAGAIDGFCVGAPWNMVAVARGVGRIVAVKEDIWPSSPEKVIGTRPEWAEQNPETLSRLIVALDHAAAWCDIPDNRRELAQVLAEQRYLDASAEIVHRVLLGEFTIDPDGTERTVPEYFSFHRDAANFPWTSQAQWIFSQMVRWGQVAYAPETSRQVLTAFRPDLYRNALGSRSDVPVDDLRVEGGAMDDGFIDGEVFNPQDIPAYLAGFDIQTSQPKSPEQTEI